MRMCRHLRYLPLALLLACPAETASEGEDWLKADDECQGATCALQALQLSGTSRHSATDHPPLCDPAIVKETCAGVNRLTTDYFNTATDKSSETLHAAELAEQLMVSRSSIRKFLQNDLGLKNLEVDASALEHQAFAVSCPKLCDALVESIPAPRRPPSSDVACYMPHGQTKAKCDIDVSDTALEASIRIGELEQEVPADQAFGESAGDHKEKGEDDKEVSHYKDLLAKQTAESKSDLAVLDALNYPDKDPDQLRVAIANLFRIYPLNNIQVAASSEASPSLLETQRNWQDDVQKTAIRAQAYTATATRSITSSKADEELMLWFGKTSTGTKKEVRRILNQVNSLLSNVEYVYPGSQCSENKFAYVIPTPPHNMNSRGQFLFYLCDRYVSSDMSAQVETLTHEASHHRMSLLDDMCYKGSGSDCQVAYGRIACENLAADNASAAIKNADNFAYFVNDVQPKPHLPQCPKLTQKRCTADPTCVCSKGLYQTEVQTSTGAVCYACGKTRPKKPPSKKNHASTDKLCKTTDTGGTCKLFLCSRTRGPTSCSSGRCLCQPGLCAEDGYCVPPRVNLLGAGPDSSEEGCEKETGGTCKFLWCWHGRGPTQCKDGKCVCREGYCTKDGNCQPKLNP